MRFCRRLPHHHHCEWLLQRLLLVWGWTRQTSEMWCTGVLRRTWNNMCGAQGGLEETARPLMPYSSLALGWTSATLRPACRSTRQTKLNVEDNYCSEILTSQLTYPIRAVHAVTFASLSASVGTALFRSCSKV